MADKHDTDALDFDMELSPIISELLELSARKNEDRANRVVLDAETFNIFDVLNLATDEVNGHCRFLQQLLSPRASHGMGDAFLQSFFEEMPGLEAGSWLADARVSREVAFEDGRIDILVELANTCCVVIEVKIYAGDQYRQLERYGDYIKRWRVLNPNASMTQEFYLTLDGHEPSDFGTGETDVEYKCISFGEDILPWLENCIALSVSKPRVSEAIAQYAEIIKSLTGRVVMDKELANIVDAVQSSQVSYEAATQVEASLPHVRTKMLEKVFDDIEAHLKGLFPDDCQLTTDAERADIRKYYYRDERRKPFPRLKFKLKEDEKRIVALTVELGHRLWVGLVFFEIANNEWGIKRIDEEREWLFTLSSNNTGEWEAMIDSAPKEDWWLDWFFLETQTREPECSIDFKHCTSKEYSRLFDAEAYADFIKNVYKGIDQYLIKLKRLGLYTAS